MTSRIHLGSAPDSWGVWLPDDPRQTPWERFLDEFAAAGYEWLELGPYGYLPTDSARLRDELACRGLKVSAGDVMVGLHRSDAWEDGLAQASAVAELTAAVGGDHLVFLPELVTDIEPPYGLNQPRELDADAWRRLTDGVSELGRRLRETHGVQLVFHSHADSHVETPDEIERFLADTDAAAVPLCLDTGHVAYGGGDNLELIGKHPERIGYVHLKAMDPVVLEQVRNQGLAFADAVRRGVCAEPPAGVPDMAAVAEALAGTDADAFAIVEQDLFPCPPDVPLPIAQRTRGYLQGCGYGAAARQNP